MKKIERRGGRREGAGRPKTGNDFLRIRIPRQLANLIKDSAKREEKTLGEWVVEHLGLPSD